MSVFSRWELKLYYQSQSAGKTKSTYNTRYVNGVKTSNLRKKHYKAQAQKEDQSLKEVEKISYVQTIVRNPNDNYNYQ